MDGATFPVCHVVLKCSETGQCSGMQWHVVATSGYRRYTKTHQALMVLRRKEYQGAIFDGKADEGIEDQAWDVTERLDVILKHADPKMLGFAWQILFAYLGISWHISASYVGLCGIMWVCL